jgi:methionine sulfoxide reductase catalytic subunit
MAFIHIPKPWQLPERQATPEAAFGGRRRFLKTMAGAGIAGAALPLIGCQKQIATDSPLAGTRSLSASQNPNFAQVDRELTNETLAATYNNFYEFGGTKTIWQNAQALPVEDWKVEVTGLVNNPQTYDLDDLQNKFPLEERLYRFRCVEAWAMVVPWIGFPMNAILKAADPKPNAKFVRFTSFYDAAIMKGPSFPPSQFLPFPYTEGLRIDEMANDLAFFAVGVYGHSLPKQHGAPVRAVIPWKYGFKGAKSIAKIEFVETQPATFWNRISPGEYKFESNVDPKVSHPRWSQAKERLIGPDQPFNWQEVPTLKYNGYEEFVGALYA